jgi:hypothetical protein
MSDVNDTMSDTGGAMSDARGGKEIWKLEGSLTGFLK